MWGIEVTVAGEENGHGGVAKLDQWPRRGVAALRLCFGVARDPSPEKKGEAQSEGMACGGKWRLRGVPGCEGEGLGGAAVVVAAGGSLASTQLCVCLRKKTRAPWAGPDGPLP